MKTIPFDVKYRPQVESGEYELVCTNQFNNGEVEKTDGLRIICWDYDTDKIICGVKKPSGHECMWICYKDGKLVSCEHKYIMLCDTKEAELTGFEQAVKDLVFKIGYATDLSGNPVKDLHLDNTFIKRESDKLLKIVNDIVYPVGILDIMEKYCGDCLPKLPKWVNKKNDLYSKVSNDSRFFGKRFAIVFDETEGSYYLYDRSNDFALNIIELTEKLIKKD